MNKLTDWLEKEISGWRLYLFMFGSLVALLLYTLLICNISPFFKPNAPLSLKSVDIPLSFLLVIVIDVFIAAAVEELYFRAPLLIAAEFFKPKTIVIFAVIISAIFGLMHGGVHHIYLQGVDGLIYSAIVLKAGGLQRRPFKALLVSTIIHALYNLTVVPMMLLVF